MYSMSHIPYPIPYPISYFVSCIQYHTINTRFSHFIHHILLFASSILHSYVHAPRALAKILYLHTYIRVLCILRVIFPHSTYSVSHILHIHILLSNVAHYILHALLSHIIFQIAYPTFQISDSISSIPFQFKFF